VGCKREIWLVLMLEGEVDAEGARGCAPPASSTGAGGHGESIEWLGISMSGRHDSWDMLMTLLLCMVGGCARD
jgi:hypothetical protein